MTTPNKQDNGGPAFPCPVGHIECYHPEGMTLLDWFAGQALGGLYETECHLNADELSSWAYELATAMVAEKRRREQQ